MNKAIQCLELAQLKSQLTEAYLSQAIEELSTAIKKLEDCLNLRAEAAPDDL
jgi:hypothetical protein